MTSALAAAVVVSVAFTAAPSDALAGKTKWGNAIVSGERAKLQGCRTRVRSAYGPLWRIQVRGNNRRGRRGALTRARVIRNYWSQNKRNRVVNSWARKVPRGGIRRGRVAASIIKRDVVRLVLKRGNGTGALSWVLDPKQLPPCGMNPQRRHWVGGALKSCVSLMGGGYGPVYRIWAIGDNRRRELRTTFSVTVNRDGREIDRWRKVVAPGKVSSVGVLHASVLAGDEVGGGYSDREGGAGSGIFPELANVC